MQVKKRELVKKSIMDSCPTCVGQGCRECASKLERINKWASVGIPVAYWNYSINTFSGDEHFKAKIVDMAENIDEVYADGKSYAFVGKFGIGKTFGATYLLKAAINSGYTCKYTTMNEIIEVALSKDQDKYSFRYDILNADFCVIDEMSNRFISASSNAQELFGSNLEYLIRSRLQNNLPTFFCTNDIEITDTFGGNFEGVFSSLFSGSNLEVVHIAGQDLRGVK